MSRPRIARSPALVRLALVIALVPVLVGCGATRPVIDESTSPMPADPTTLAEIQAHRDARSDRYPVSLGGKRAGYIDHTGTVVATLPVGYEAIGRFADNRAIVVTPDGRGYVDPSGTLVVGGTFTDARDFSQGLAMVQERGNRRYGYVDTNGTIVIPPQFSEATPFSEGLAAVLVKEPTSGRYLWGYIDQRGAFVIPPQFEQATSFSEGRARIADRVPNQYCESGSFDLCYDTPGSVRFIDPTGRVVTPGYLWAGTFSEGRAVVFAGPSWEERQAGYIDRDGAMVIAPQFTEATSFSGGVAVVAQRTAPGERRRMIIDRGGATVYDGYRRTTTRTGNNTYFQSDSGLKIEKPFSEGVTNAEHYQNNSSRPVYVDAQGRVVLRPQCWAVGPFSGGIAPCSLKVSDGFLSLKDVRTYIDRTGKTIWRDKT